MGEIHVHVDIPTSQRFNFTWPSDRLGIHQQVDALGLVVLRARVARRPAKTERNFMIFLGTGEDGSLGLDMFGFFQWELGKYMNIMNMADL